MEFKKSFLEIFIYPKWGEEPQLCHENFENCRRSGTKPEIACGVAKFSLLWCEAIGFMQGFFTECVVVRPLHMHVRNGCG